MSERDTFDDGASTSAPFPFCYEHQFAKPCPKCYAVKRTPGLDALERAVLAACVEEDKKSLDAEDAWSKFMERTTTYPVAMDARDAERESRLKRIAAVRRYRALLDGKAEGKEA